MVEVSVIIPAFNEADNIQTALESVIAQKTGFEFEIIVVDDGSTDDTNKIVEAYRKQFDFIHLLTNEKNRGKGYSFCSAYARAKGKYFQVLDGDDFFTNFNKLQVQKDFLDKNPDYFAVCHNHAQLYVDGRVDIFNPSDVELDYSYEDIFCGRFYAHTSTIMFRKLPEKLPSIFLERPMRGDTGCLFYHAFKMRTKVKFLPFVGSVYNIQNKGIWTKLTQRQQLQFNYDLFRFLRDKMVVDKRLYEFHCLNGVCQYYQNSLSKGGEKGNNTCNSKWSIEEVIKYCFSIMSIIYDQKFSETLFLSMHAMKQIDSICETMGRIILLREKMKPAVGNYKKKTAAFVLSCLSPNGGGIASEVRELVNIHLNDGWQVNIIFSGLLETKEEMVTEYFNDERIKYWFADKNDKTFVEKVTTLMKTLATLSVERLYPFIAHTDVIQSVALQRGLAEKVVVDYVYDHGTSAGIFNSSIDVVVTKTEVQSSAIAKAFGKQVVCYIPPLLRDKRENDYRQPSSRMTILNKMKYASGKIKNNKKLTNVFGFLVRKQSVRLANIFHDVVCKTTACAAARSYKIEAEYEPSYLDIVCQILKITNGMHYHYGPLSDQFKEKLAEKCNSGEMNENQFIHVNWSDDLSASLLEHKVDLFVAPFPVASALAVIEVMSAGIPILNHFDPNGQLPQSQDFTGESQLVWHDRFELSRILINLTKESLDELSRLSRRHFLDNNEVQKNKIGILKLAGRPFLHNLESKIELHDLNSSSGIAFDRWLFKPHAAA